MPEFNLGPGDTLFDTGNSGDDTVFGEGGNDTIIGGSGNDSLFGGDGNDLINESGAAADEVDALFGDAGDDVVYVYGLAPSGSADGDTGTDTVVITGRIPGAPLGNDGIEIVFSDDFLVQRGGLPTLHLTGFEVLVADGTQGDDRIIGGHGNDTIRGQGGADTLGGGAGDDRIEVNRSGRAVVDGGRGTDTFVLRAFLNLSDMAIEAGADFASQFFGRPVQVSRIEVIDAVTGGGNDTVLGGAFGDFVQSGDGNDRLEGRAGDDWLNAQDGRDTVYGGEGNDSILGLGRGLFDGGDGDDQFTLSVRGGAQTVYGGAGNDRISLSVNDQADVIDGGGDFDVLVLQPDLDPFQTGAIGTRFEAGLVVVTLDGAEVMRATGIEAVNVQGGAGDNVLSGGASGDTLQGGEAGNDLLTGFGGNDVLTGGGGRDTLAGGGGDDRLTGGQGLDTLRGSGGADVFAIAAVVTDGGKADRDAIRDFVQGEDVIDLSALGDGTGPAFAVIGDAAFGGARQLRAEVVDGWTRVTGDIDGNGVADLRLDLQGVFTLTVDDFVL